MHKTTPLNQKGLVSIVVTMIIMTILSLITIGFAQIMAKEQRQALDRQLSSQAFYAAESGINDALANPAGYSDISCSSADVEASLGIRVPCITYKDVTENLRYDAISIDPHTPTVFPLPAGTASFSILFNNSQPNANPQLNRADDSLPAFNAWNAKPGVLKVQIIPFTNNDTQNDISTNSGMSFVIPRAAGTSPYDMSSISGASFGTTTQADCTAAGCTVSFDGIDTTANSVTVVLSSMYIENSAEINAFGSLGNPLDFDRVQALIDSTGRTADVVRRIQIRKPLIPSYPVPAGALESTGNGPADGICKQFSTSPASTSGCPF